MAAYQSEILLTLVKLRYFLISLIESPEECYDNFNISEEFFERRNIINGNELLEKLQDNGINNDCDIAFNKDIHNIFKIVSQDFSSNPDLKSMLEEFEIDEGQNTEESKPTPPPDNSPPGQTDTEGSETGPQSV